MEKLKSIISQTPRAPIMAVFVCFTKPVLMYIKLGGAAHIATIQWMRAIYIHSSGPPDSPCGTQCVTSDLAGSIWHSFEAADKCHDNISENLSAFRPPLVEGREKKKPLD